ncbi:uncharacterized protein LOC127756395 [Oryza glaberrima]|nr:uncharacterized protein LOC127756395 [Oryza glaberrima]
MSVVGTWRHFYIDRPEEEKIYKARVHDAPRVVPAAAAVSAQLAAALLLLLLLHAVTVVVVAGGGGSEVAVDRYAAAGAMLLLPRRRRQQLEDEVVFPAAMAVVGAEQLQQGGSFSGLTANKQVCLQGHSCAAFAMPYTGHGCIYRNNCKQ